MKRISAIDFAIFLGKAFFFLLPLAFITATYFVVDPFKVLGSYEDFYNTSPPHVVLNRGYVSTELYLRHYKKYQYDSFIFGSSRSLAYQTKDWQPYIGKASPFHWDSSGESLFGILGALKLIDRTGGDIKNALLIIDPLLLKQDSEDERRIAVHHPQVSGWPWLKFQWKFFRGYFERGFCIRYWDLKLFKTERPYMYEMVFSQNYFFSDPVTNDYSSAKNEEAIEANPKKYYSNRKRFGRVAHTGGGGENEAVLKDKQVEMLHDIRSIFLKKKTQYKIVISPLFDQKKINRKDLKILQNVFGERTIHDFSGSNELTRNIRNYRDSGHYRPHVARHIMKSVYEKD